MRGIVKVFDERGKGFLRCLDDRKLRRVYFTSNLPLWVGTLVQFDVTGTKAINVHPVAEGEKLSGVIHRWFADRGYGFVRVEAPGHRDVFLHRSDSQDGSELREGVEVDFDLIHNDRGTRAINVAVKAGQREWSEKTIVESPDLLGSTDAKGVSHN